jgi:hypothetical protein
MVKVISTHNPDKGTTSLIVGGVHHTNRSDPNAVIHKAAWDYKGKPTQRNLNYLMGMLQPTMQVMKQAQLGAEWTTIEGKVYLEGTTIEVPPELVRKIELFVEKKLPMGPLVNMWALCCLNPNEKARNGLFRYVDTYGITITDNGYIIFYKYVDVHTQAKYSQDLAPFVGEAVIHAKSKKKGRKQFNIYKDEEGDFQLLAITRKIVPQEWKLVGNLEDLHNNLEEIGAQSEMVWTDYKTHSFRIRLGQAQYEDRAKCNTDINVGCAFGLHVGAEEYIKRWAPPGSSVLATLVNPMDVVAIPKHATSKLRCCRYFPYALMARDAKGDWEEVQDEVFEDDYRTWERDDHMQKLLSDGKEEGEKEVAVSPVAKRLYLGQ